jgi:hypothetical protein
MEVRDRQQRWFDHKQSDHLQLMYRLTLLPPFELTQQLVGFVRRPYVYKVI